MTEPIAPQGYRRYEPTTNNAKFIKFQSQIPIEEYESYRDHEQTVDVVENTMRNMQMGSNLHINPDCGDASLNSQGGAALGYAARMFGGHSTERDYFWQEYNRKNGVGASPLVQQAAANQFGSRQQFNQIQQMPQPQAPMRYSPDPMEDFAERIKRISSEARPERSPSPLQPNATRTLPGMIRNAASVMNQNNSTEQLNDEQIAMEVKQRREAMKQRLESMAAKAPKPQPIITNKQPIQKPIVKSTTTNLRFEKI